MWAFLALSLAVLSNRQAAVLVFALPISVIFISYLTRRSISSILSLSNLAGVAILGATGFFMFLYKIPNGMHSIQVDGGRGDERNRVIFDVLEWAKHGFTLELALPYALAFMPIMLFSTFLIWRKDGFQSIAGVTYLFLVFAFAGGLSALVIGEVHGTRFWLFVLPLYALFVSIGIAVITRAWSGARSKVLGLSDVTLRAAVLLALGGALLSTLVGVQARGGQFLEIICEGYGLPCRVGDCTRTVEFMYDQLRPNVEPEDIVVSSRPTFSYIYLDKVDILLAKKL